MHSSHKEGFSTKEQYMQTLASDGPVFLLKRFIAAPNQVGSIAPSSRFLVNGLLGQASWENVRHVAELGAGTGVMTRRILEVMHPDTSLKVFELDDAMRANLEKELYIHVDPDACDLSSLVNPGSLDLVVSSLPWTTLPRSVSRKILQGIVTCLKPTGQFLAYQYSRQMRHCFSHLFQSVQISFVLRNIPPAFVYSCRRPQPEQAQNVYYYLS